MTTEKAEALADLRAVYGELFPYRNTDHWQPSDDVLAAIVLIRRQLEANHTPAMSLRVKKAPTYFVDPMPRYTGEAE
jgi:hypothetical protein